MARLRNRLSLVSALALVASAGLARAADVPVEPSPVYSAVPAANWSGFYAGTLVGYGWAEADADGSSDTLDGATSGAVIGHNWQSGNWVYGLEGDITLHEIRGPVGALDVDTLYSAHLRGRLGYDFGRFLPYIAGGFATNETYVRSGTPNGANERLNGWTVGAGVDVKLGDTFIGPILIRAEYLYEDFGDETFALAGSGPVEAGHGTHFARLGIISYLGGDAPVFDGSSVDWSGAYGGLFVGYGRHDVETNSADGVSEEIEADGALGGIYTGRNFQFGNVVAGWEGSIALTDIEGDGVYPVPPQDHSYRGDIQADARARLGYAFGKFLPFVSAGVSWTRSEQALGIGGVTALQRGRVPAVAWTVGAGVDYRISDRWSLRGEYLYARDDDPKTPEFGAPVATDQEIEVHQVRFGTAYHF